MDKGRTIVLQRDFLTVYILQYLTIHHDPLPLARDMSGSAVVREIVADSL
jgi:hypothetical protein